MGSVLTGKNGEPFCSASSKPYYGARDVGDPLPWVTELLRSSWRSALGWAGHWEIREAGSFSGYQIPFRVSSGYQIPFRVWCNQSSQV
jgi:hypothetical protein